MQDQQSTQSIFYKEIQPTFTSRSLVSEAGSKLKDLANWYTQTLVPQGASKTEHPWMVTGASTISVPQTDATFLYQLRVVQRLYTFRGDRIEILRFLERYPFLVSLLVEADTHIEKHFPLSLIFLTVVTDPEEFGTEQLIVYIATDLGPDEATDLLSDFDKKWWLKSLKRAQGKLCITVEFQ
jgi:hypothetical protein